MKHVTFYSTSFCPTCKFLKPKVQEVYPDTEFVLLDDDMELAGKLGIATVPTIIFWNSLGTLTGDEEIKRLSGGVTIQQQFKDALIEVGML